MKKIIATIVTAFALASSAFAWNIGTRYVEMRMTAPFSMSNNAFGFNDIFQEEIVIDFDKLYNSFPKQGWTTSIFTQPEYQLNFNFRKFWFGIQTGLNMSGSTSVSKDTFEFLANGNRLGEPISLGASGDLDAFAFVRIPVGFKVKKASVTVTPTCFIPIMHASVSDASATVTNSADGTFRVDGKMGMEVFTAFDEQAITSKNPEIDKLLMNMGIDLGVDVKVPLPVIKNFDIKGSVQVPIVPGKFSSVSAMDMNMVYGFNMIDSSKNFNSFSMTELQTKDCTKNINRPLVFMGGVEWNLLKGGLLLDGSAGCAVRYPFSDEAKFYFQYNAKATLNAWNIFGLTVGTEYMDQVFRQSLSFMLNLRAVEFDAGVSLSGTDFKSCFQGKGVGAFVTACIGF